RSSSNGRDYETRSSRRLRRERGDQVATARVGHGHAEFVHVARKIDRFAPQAVAEGQCVGQRLGPPIDPIQKQPIWSVVEVVGVVRGAADAEAVGSRAWQRKSPRHLAKQAGVAAEALSRAENGSATVQNVELEVGLRRSVLRLEERIELVPGSPR